MSGELRDIVDRLRSCGVYLSDGAGDSFGNWRPQSFRPDPLCSEAANEIERLRREVSRLGNDLDDAWGENTKQRGRNLELRTRLQRLSEAVDAKNAAINEQNAYVGELLAEIEGRCDTCQMRVRANHAHDDTCGYCSGGPVVNDDCPIHGAASDGERHDD